MRNIIEIKRPGGNIEIVDITEKFIAINETVVKKIADATAAAGRGTVMVGYVIHDEHVNHAELERIYADIYCEGNMDGAPEDLETLKKALPNHVKIIPASKKVVYSA